MLIASGDANDQQSRYLRARYGDSAWIVPMERGHLLEKIEERFRARMARDAAFGLHRAEPHLSARYVVTLGQCIVFATIALTAAFAFSLAGPTMSVLTVTILALAFLANVIFRAALVWVGADLGSEAPVAANESLPRYTIIVALYREANMVAELVKALRAIDYPVRLLDVHLVLEADDDETLLAVASLGLSAPFEVVRVPRGAPRTKPRACNYALNFARGEFVVIYDAEDRPEPDQLKKAVAQFRASAPDVACFQARLNFYNARRNWLTAIFSLDYGLWFDFLLPGLDKLGVPMPLGGTSNHLRVSVLREINGWDPFNVTEDADLGIRLAEKGYRVSILNSTTFEEASHTLPNWTRQRSRWLKGYMQTWLVHMRNPARLIRNVGWRGFLAFQLFVGGTVISALVNPLLWAVFLASQLGLISISNAEGQAAIAAISLFTLILGNAFFTYLIMLGCYRRGWLDLVPSGLGAFVYWGLISFAGYRGLIQLFTRPFHWEKTIHGFGDEGAMQ
jgi:cellulose synthase/poly-beta-1,6-N-acetylglucosamine synthase-like glycosyltransferase